jgi:4-diphosphocytidyl-2-C-methyl-D-erythritol kinase
MVPRIFFPAEPNESICDLDPMSSTKVKNGTVALARPPAKLNLFLELLARRDDGFHEIDTVMVPIDWCDELRVRRTKRAQIDLRARWLPSRQIIAHRLGVKPTSDVADRLLRIPENETNLVHRALQRFIGVFDVDGGFNCELGKSIPAGAGMGGASSDAASALRCAAALCGIPLGATELSEIAAEIGSDVPFFMGLGLDHAINAGRATGRGEKLENVRLASPLHFLVVFPAVSLSTAKVYANSQVPASPQNACRLIRVLESGRFAELESQIMNQLTEPAKKLARQIDEILESLWRVGLGTCQLTGSGSACFAIAGSSVEVRRQAARLRAMLEPGAIVVATRSTHVPAWVNTR